MILGKTLNFIETTRSLHIGAQIYVDYKGECADFCVGEDGRGKAIAPQTSLLWLSAGKPLLAALAGTFFDRKILSPDTTVASVIPEFAQNGKESITVRHLLTHTAGIRRATNTWSSGPDVDVLARICRSPIENGWIVGQTAGYHVASSWTILGEMLARLENKPLEPLMRERILAPLGMTGTRMRLSGEEFEQPRYGRMMDTTQRPPAVAKFDALQYCGMIRPAGNIRGPIRELGLFYRAMLSGGGGILRPETVKLLTTRQRQGAFDLTFKRPMDWGMGFMVNSEHLDTSPMPYGFGKHASKEAFGHGGSQSSCGMADPVNDLVVAMVFNGMCGDAKHTMRINQTMTMIYEDLF
jgi:CubicO group peptidase (beta-lactamase class C family)